MLRRAALGQPVRLALRALSTGVPCHARRAPIRGTLRHREVELRREIAELERQLQESDKREHIAQATKDLPPLDDETLEAMYRELVAPPPSDASTLPPPPPSTTSVLRALAQRWGVAALPATGSSEVAVPPGADERQALRDQLVQRLVEADGLDADLRPDEWAALAMQSARDGDAPHVKTVLALALQQGPACLPLFRQVMDVYANAGDADTVLELSAVLDTQGVAPDAGIQHVVTKAYTQTNQLWKAAQYLAHWEQTVPAPMSSYTLVMEHLLKHPVRELQPLAWSLFYHMRFAAHAVPDAALYAMMIRACAAGVPQPTALGARRPSAVVAEAERALDLFREMTVHHGIRPNKEVYDSLILTCARRKEHYGDAIQLLRQLMDLSSDPTSPMAPDTYTYNAVLQGSARHGDLATARWILADLVHAAIARGVAHGPNEETMANVLWTYAVYRPPVRRADVARASAAPDSQVDDGAAEMVETEARTFTQATPSTSPDVVAEVQALMARILADQGQADAGAHPLASVVPTPRMLNAYLSVLTHHLRPAQRLEALVHATEAPDGVFQQAAVAPNAHTWAMVLEACAQHRERAYADQVAARVWEQWRTLEAHADARIISKMWALMIRQHAKSFRVADGLALLQEFLHTYPPPTPTSRAALDGLPPPPSRLDWAPLPPPPTLLAALAAQPRTAVSADKYAPLAPFQPQLRFRDLELLHHRCVALREVAGLHLITRVDRAYRAAP
ncbi:unnamed protein product [Malassezia sympodialis ATCC 42132]|uniref:Uncharacterized protein n=1 Tax=Malassezia sympodialis (strain ATCC 42132) TaxID=1230383 RepID=M5E8E7_MALS4|nr:uncharacterized protein MSY001_1456 [Malassezia sympodialis ATCC 42132]CCU98750.1 unnamed protein product [Malassezia sympodialis ATCC 42132]SHO77451.1 Uncharacterized protein MSYG_1789 [Malassezia sympodialis ATCC 42132]|eukprot:XP_018740035.1 uncharacterized protein MSY001_1456 [Malassezia sympodialis ATCC 42132]